MRCSHHYCFAVLSPSTIPFHVQSPKNELSHEPRSCLTAVPPIAPQVMYVSFPLQSACRQRRSNAGRDPLLRPFFREKTRGLAASLCNLLEIGKIIRWRTMPMQPSSHL